VFEASAIIGTLPLDVSLFHSSISVLSMTISELMVNAQLRGRVLSTGALTVLAGANWRLITADNSAKFA
jgi:hypothetical protein